MSDIQRTPAGWLWPCVDGEPAVPGDTLWDVDGTWVEVGSVRFDREGVSVEVRRPVPDAPDGYYVTLVDADEAAFTRLSRTEPPKPVLDRDGVPIEVGDTVYAVNGASEGVAFTVKRVRRCGEFCVRVIDAPGFVYEFRPDDLTHERPDSWERLEEDVRAFRMADEACGYLGRESWECVGCPFKEDSNCYVAAAENIVRRAKALAGVVGDE